MASFFRAGSAPPRRPDKQPIRPEQVVVSQEAKRTKLPQGAEEDPILLSSDDDEERVPASKAAYQMPLVSRDFSSRMTFALPPRVGAVAQDAMSRNEIRTLCAQSLRDTHSFMAEQQVREYVTKPEGIRGRMLSAGHVAGARELVKAKVRTSTFREEADFQEADLREEEDVDVLAHHLGRARPTDPTPKPPPPGDYQLTPPREGEELVGWYIQALFPTGPRNELRWHSGFVLTYHEQQDSTVFKYNLFYNMDNQDEMVSSPFTDGDLCFRKPHLPLTKAGPRELSKATKILQELAKAM